MKIRLREHRHELIMTFITFNYIINIRSLQIYKQKFADRGRRHRNIINKVEKPL